MTLITPLQFSLTGETDTEAATIESSSTNPHEYIQHINRHIILVLTTIYILLSLVTKYLTETFDFLYIKWYHSNTYTNSIIQTFFSKYVHYGPDIGISASLKLDYPSSDIFYKRLRGQTVLDAQLGHGCSMPQDLKEGCTVTRGETLASKLVDERFSHPSHVLSPLLRELEFDAKGRTFLTQTNAVTDDNTAEENEEKYDESNQKEPQLTSWKLGILPVFPISPSSITSTIDTNNTTTPVIPSSTRNKPQITEVTTENGQTLIYLSNDPVYTLSVTNFYDVLQEEINTRMSLDFDKFDDTTGTNDAMLRFVPTSFTPELEQNVEQLLSWTGLDQVRYSLGGAEAMDATFKDIKASCRNKQIIVRFRPACYNRNPSVHGCDNDDYECGFGGGPVPIFLDECSSYGLKFIERYHFRIAAVVVNPIMHFLAFQDPESLPTISNEKEKHESYAKWLHQLMDQCNYCTQYLTKVAFVVDDREFALRMPELLSTHFFKHPDTGNALRPNVLVLGNGIAAGYPLSVVVGQNGYLNSYDKKFLLQVNKTVGTLSSWHGGIVASNVFMEAVLAKEEEREHQITNKGNTKEVKATIHKVFLKDVNGPMGFFMKDKGNDIDKDLVTPRSRRSNIVLSISARTQYREMMERCNVFRDDLNARFQKHDLPLHIHGFSNVFTIQYMTDCLYNGRYAQYLMAQDIYLQTNMTSKGFQFRFTADTTEEDLTKLGTKFVTAGIKMKADGFFEPYGFGRKTQLIIGLVFRFAQNYLCMYYDQIMSDKKIDIDVSHNHPVNKFGHFWSSIGMIFVAYPYIVMGKTFEGCFWFFFTHVIRQSGHFFYEHQDLDIEKLKFGHKDKSKKEAVVALGSAYLMYKYRDEICDILIPFCQRLGLGMGWLPLSRDQYVSLVALFTVIPHYVEITHQYGVLRGISWMLKILTDPLTDLIDFYQYIIINPKWFFDLKNQCAVYKLDIITKKVLKVSSS